TRHRISGALERVGPKGRCLSSSARSRASYSYAGGLGSSGWTGGMGAERLGYREAVAELEARGIMPLRPPGLEAMREALRRLDISFAPERVVVVAGTNGKGSVCAMLESLLRSAGVRTGLYTSPHLIETRERIRIDGTDVDEETFSEAHAQARAVT